MRDRIAGALLRLARRRGSQYIFINPGESPLTVWGFSHTYTQTTGVREGVTDETSQKYQVPRQTGFPPGAFLPGCTIQHGSIVLGIDSITPDNDDPTEASSFVLSCSRYGITAELD